LRLFFILLCQMLIMQVFYLIVQVINHAYLIGTNAYYRTEDIQINVSMTSYIFMYIGFSRMVAKAYNDISTQQST
jgi:hypothetical protein